MEVTQFITGQAHNRSSTQQVKHTTGQAHNRSSTQYMYVSWYWTTRLRRLDRKTYIWGDQSFADISKLALANLVQQLHVMFTECLAKYWTCVRLTDLCIVSSSCCVCEGERETRGLSTQGSYLY